jgi:hypothetical protein
MHRGNSTLSAVQKQNGNAIGGSDSYTLPDLVRDQGVTFGLAIAQWVRIQNLIRVNLPQRDVGGWIRCTGTETVRLPNELLESIAPIDAVSSEAE